MSQRVVALEGADNFRDLGGYRTDNGQRVGWHRLYRSASLQELTKTDIRLLREELGVAAVIDLRAPSEAAREGLGRLQDAGMDYLNVPVIHEHDGYRYEIPERVDLAALYYEVLEQSGQSLGRIFQLLAEESGTPAVIHCAAGKDRTGMVSAIILGCLGVSGDDVVADYALSGPHMAAVKQRLRRLPSYGERVDQVPDAVWGAAPGNMAGLLRQIAQHYGGPRQWVLAHGVDDVLLRAVQDALLEDC